MMMTLASAAPPGHPESPVHAQPDRCQIDENATMRNVMTMNADRRTGHVR